LQIGKHKVEWTGEVVTSEITNCYSHNNNLVEKKQPLSKGRKCSK